ncbi:hypothetical protein EJB05_34222, partial [Eragrostis curvula]
MEVSCRRFVPDGSCGCFDPDDQKPIVLANGLVQNPNVDSTPEELLFCLCMGEIQTIAHVENSWSAGAVRSDEAHSASGLTSASARPTQYFLSYVFLLPLGYIAGEEAAGVGRWQNKEEETCTMQVSTSPGHSWSYPLCSHAFC